MPTLPTVRCDYKIPMNANDKPLATASDIVLLFPYPTEKAAITGLARPLTEKMGFTTISIRFPGMGPKDGVDGDDRSRWYYWPESGSGKAWLDAIVRIRKIGGFPERQVFVTGRSGGGSAAGLFADAHPEAVAAVANEAGRLFANELRFKGPVLIMHGAHDYVAPFILAYEARARSTGVQLTRLTYPASWGGRGTNLQLWQHGIYGPAEQAMWRWLVAVADMRLDKGGKIPPAATWPVQEGGASLPSTEVRDLLDQVVPIAQRSQVASAQVIVARTAAAKPPKGVLVIAGGGFASDPDELAFDAEYFADRGWLTVAACGDSSPIILPALRAALSRSDLAAAKGLPWLLVADEPDNLPGYAGLLTKPMSGAFLCNARGSALSVAAQVLSSASIPTLVIDKQEQLDQLKRGMDRSPALIWKAIKPTNVGLWHLQRCVAVADQADRWLSAKK